MITKLTYVPIYVCTCVCVLKDYLSRLPLPDVPHFLEINRELPPTPQPTSTCNTEKIQYYQFEKCTDNKKDREAWKIEVFGVVNVVIKNL